MAKKFSLKWKLQNSVISARAKRDLVSPSQGINGLMGWRSPTLPSHPAILCSATGTYLLLSLSVPGQIWGTCIFLQHSQLLVTFSAHKTQPKLMLQVVLLLFCSLQEVLPTVFSCCSFILCFHKVLFWVHANTGNGESEQHMEFWGRFHTWVFESYTMKICSATLEVNQDLAGQLRI